MAHDFESELYENIPITKQMGVSVVEVTAQRAVLRAPLQPNSNHNETAFGGSIYSTAVLSCWALASETVRAAGLNAGYIVIQNGEIEYETPIDSEFFAEAEWSSSRARDKFIDALTRFGVGRAKIASVIRSTGEIRARFSGRFVAQIRGSRK